MMKIKVQENGPYLVTGNVPISEWIIVPNGKAYVFKEGRKLPQMESYSLCRCGMSDISPFCDGSHLIYDFKGEETASRMDYLKRADVLNGPGMRLLDDNRCAFARFCHREGGSVWELTIRSDNEHDRSEAIIAASECPAGRLVAVEEDGRMIEPDLEPGIEIIQDPQKGCSSGIYVKGGILVEACDGHQYEVRNRIMLCRCGKSRNKPFCDASHVGAGFHDGFDEQAN
jgi:CDGSH-type Zn-finger protein